MHVCNIYIYSLFTLRLPVRMQGPAVFFLVLLPLYVVCTLLYVVICCYLLLFVVICCIDAWILRYLQHKLVSPRKKTAKPCMRTGKVRLNRLYDWLRHCNLLFTLPWLIKRSVTECRLFKVLFIFNILLFAFSLPLYPYQHVKLDVRSYCLDSSRKY